MEFDEEIILGRLRLSNRSTSYTEAERVYTTQSTCKLAVLKAGNKSRTIRRKNSSVNSDQWVQLMLGVSKMC